MQAGRKRVSGDALRAGLLHEVVIENSVHRTRVSVGGDFAVVADFCAVGIGLKVRAVDPVFDRIIAERFVQRERDRLKGGAAK